MLTVLTTALVVALLTLVGCADQDTQEIDTPANIQSSLFTYLEDHGWETHDVRFPKKGPNNKPRLTYFDGYYGPDTPFEWDGEIPYYEFYIELSLEDATTQKWALLCKHDDVGWSLVDSKKLSYFEY